MDALSYPSVVGQNASVNVVIRIGENDSRGADTSTRSVVFQSHARLCSLARNLHSSFLMEGTSDRGDLWLLVGASQRHSAAVVAYFAPLEDQPEICECDK